MSTKRTSPNRDEFAGGRVEDELPATRTGRMAEFGRLGLSLVSSAVRAGARGFVGGFGNREQALTDAHRAGAAVLLRSLGRLRGSAAKIGQFLAQRPGTLPDEYIEAMLTLADKVPAMSAPTVDMQIANELGKLPRALFASFERHPIAAGSFGQVHPASLPDGTKVVVKVQYPAVEDALAADLANLEMVLPALEKLTERDDLPELVAELRERLMEELDYRLEAENCLKFRSFFANQPMEIPRVHEAFSSPRVLTLDFVEGDSIETYLNKGPSLEERNRAALLLLRFHFASVLEHGLLHVDPNPGNYLFRQDGRLGIVDFGCVKRFSPDFAELLREIYRAAAEGTDRGLDDVLVECGMFPPDVDDRYREPMRKLARLWAKPCNTPDFDFGDRQYLDELTNLQHQLAREGAVKVPPEWLFYSRQVLGCSYLLYRLGGKHKSQFIANFEQIVSGAPLASAGQAKAPKAAKAAKVPKVAVENSGAPAVAKGRKKAAAKR